MELTGCSYLDIARSIAFLDITPRCSPSHCSPIAAWAPMVTHMMCPSCLTDTSLPSPWTALPFVPTAPPTGSHIGFSAGDLSTQIPLWFTPLLISGIGFYATCASRFYYRYQTPGINNLKRGHSYLISIFKGFSSWFLDPRASASHRFDGSIFRLERKKREAARGPVTRWCQGPTSGHSLSPDKLHFSRSI